MSKCVAAVDQGPLEVCWATFVEEVDLNRQREVVLAELEENHLIQ